jgi:putative spermidine/putrescine transport system substrate-binding protein
MVDGRRAARRGAAAEPGWARGLGTAKAAGGWTRRRFVGLGAAGAIALAAGCEPFGEDDDVVPTVAVGTPGPAATPTGFIPGYEEPTRWAGRVLRVAGWGAEIQDALRTMVWEPFGRATGCTVQELITDYNQLRAGVARGEPYADALVVDAEFAVTALEAGIAQALPAGTGDGADLVNGTPAGATPQSVPAYAYAMVSAYRREAIEDVLVPPATWTEWWDATAFPGNRTLYKGPLGTFEFALLSDGVPREALYPLDGARAIERLKQISGRIVDRWWESGLQPVSWLSRGRADFGSAWHYRVLAGQDDGQPVELVWDEGLLLTDHWLVPVESPNADVAVDFLRYATAPEVQAALGRAVGLGPVAAGAFERLDPLFATSLPTHPDNLPRLVPQDVAWWADHRGEAEERFNSWLLGVAYGG